PDHCGMLADSVLTPICATKPSTHGFFDGISLSPIPEGGRAVHHITSASVAGIKARRHAVPYPARTASATAGQQVDYAG
ncbi:hypothetical protein, partial [Azospirillum griseum]|uniref:hypothetical protein n=1 Tax=Azospirillum griseum TaxID=2496639 RepID=UPI003638FBDE